jgi:hypothetical protein
MEASDLSDIYWSTTLPQDLIKSGVTNPQINIFFAAQVKKKNRGFLSSDILVENMIQHRGDIHHLFPYDYLKKQGLERSEMNQIANFVYAETGINVRIGNKSPKEYFADVLAQVRGGKAKYGSITDEADLKKNLQENCIPESIFELTYEDYEQFLVQRRKLMAQKIEKYYKNL